MRQPLGDISARGWERVASSIVNAKTLEKSFNLNGQLIRVLRGIDLTVVKGDYLAIMGESGSGKSTLLSLIGCLESPTSGELSINGVDVTYYSESQLAWIRNREIGFIFQDFNLLPKLSVKENVELPLIYKGVPSVDRKSRVTEVIESMGLGDRINHRPNQLSGGQKQRVAIARALVKKPSLILANEPTGNLDKSNTALIVELLHQLHEQGNSILLITHDPSVASHAEKTFRLSDGLLV